MMGVFTRRAPRRHTTTPPEPTATVTAVGAYRLFDDSLFTSHRPRYFTTLAEAMAATGHPDPTHWVDHPSDRDRIFLQLDHQYVGVYEGFVRWTIDGPGAASEFRALLADARRAAEEKRHVEEQERRERWKAAQERLKAVEAAEKAKREAEEAAKPKLVISYLTRAGEALGDAGLCVKVVTRPGYSDSTDHTETVATCKACGESETVQWDGQGWDHQRWMNDQFDTDGKVSTPRAQKWAQEHAAECRAMPAKS